MSNLKPPTFSAQPPSNLSLQSYHEELNKKHPHSLLFPLIAITLIALAILAIVTERIIGVTLHRPLIKKLYLISGLALCASVPFLVLSVKSVSSYETSKKNLLEITYENLKQIKKKKLIITYLKEELLSTPDKPKRSWQFSTKTHFLNHLKKMAEAEKEIKIIDAIKALETELQKDLKKP